MPNIDLRLPDRRCLILIHSKVIFHKLRLKKNTFIFQTGLDVTAIEDDFLFLGCAEGIWDLIFSLLGIEPTPPAMEAQSLNRKPPGSPKYDSFSRVISNCCAVENTVSKFQKF